MEGKNVSVSNGYEFLKVVQLHTRTCHHECTVIKAADCFLDYT